MHIALTTLNRLMLMFVLMLIGFVLHKKKLIENDGIKDMGKLLLYVILPAVVIKSYNMDFSINKAVGLMFSFIAAVIALAIAVIISRVCFGKKYPIESFGAAFSNAGFMGIPLVQSVFGSETVYYAASFVAILNILQWTYGVFIMTGRKDSISSRNVLLNPILISFFVGVGLFLLPFKLPDFLVDSLDFLAALNAPIAMIILGAYLAQTKFKDLFTHVTSYKVCLVRLMIIPAVTLLALWGLPIGDYELKQTVLILAAAPIGTNVAVYAQLNGGNYKQAVNEVVLSTVMSAFTMPLIIGISDYIL